MLKKKVRARDTAVVRDNSGDWVLIEKRLGLFSFILLCYNVNNFKHQNILIIVLCEFINSKNNKLLDSLYTNTLNRIYYFVRDFSENDYVVTYYRKSFVFLMF